VIIRQLTTK